jgi:hypothetical protein
MAFGPILPQPADTKIREIRGITLAREENCTHGFIVASPVVLGVSFWPEAGTAQIHNVLPIQLNA